MSVPAFLHDLCFQLRGLIFLVCYCFHELLEICMSFLIEFACVCVCLSVQPPAESVQDSGQCVDAPCEDAPPPIPAPTPSQAPEPPPSSATVPPTDITLSVPAVPAPARSTSPDLPQTDGLGALLAPGDSGAEGGASLGMATSAPGQAETPMAAVKLESVLDPTELSTVSAERWRSRGRGGRGRGGEGSLRVLHRLNKVNLKKPPDQNVQARLHSSVWCCYSTVHCEK